MIVEVINGAEFYQADLSRPIDISLPLRPGGINVNAFYAPNFEAEPVRMGNFVGSVEEGGAVNFMNVQLNPHGNGTHTECVGHISQERYTIHQCLKQFFFIAELISVYPITVDNGDGIIFREQIEKALNGKKPEAVVIRTLPNDELKMIAKYSGKNPPYLHFGAADYLKRIGVQHLLIDLPSVDREEDGGKLHAHKAFWDYPHFTRQKATITELIYVANKVKDGSYLLNLQIASFELDASPSKPVLYELD